MFWIASFSGSGAVRTFSSIPQTFTHLQLRMFVRDTFSSAASTAFVRFNGDTGSNYVCHYLNGNGSSASSGASLSQSYLTVGDIPAGTSTANVYGSLVVDILDYTNTNKNKVTKTLGGFDANGSGIVSLYSGLWLNTAAITSIQCGATSLGDASGTYLSLYGVTSSQVTGA
jgi:hypothetical protein